MALIPAFWAARFFLIMTPTPSLVFFQPAFVIPERFPGTQTYSWLADSPPIRRLSPRAASEWCLGQSGVLNLDCQ